MARECNLPYTKHQTQTGHTWKHWWGNHTNDVSREPQTTTDTYNNSSLQYESTHTVTYASETWILTKRDSKQINIFERKVYRRILGPLHDNEKEN